MGQEIKSSLGLSKNCIYMRLRAGWSYHRATTTPVRDPHASRNPSSLHARALNAGLDPAMVARRIRRGWSLRRALRVQPIRSVPRGENPKIRAHYRYIKERQAFVSELLGSPVTQKHAMAVMRDLRLAGIIKRTSSKISAATIAARANGFNPATIQSRLWRGMSLEEALSVPFRGKSPIHLAAIAAGLKPQAVIKRIKRGWTEVDALKLPLRDCENSIAAKARLAGIPAHTVVTRIRKLKWPEAEALSVPVGQIRQSKPKRTDTLISKIKVKGLSVGLVWARIHRLGWSEKRALSTPSMRQGA